MSMKLVSRKYCLLRWIGVHKQISGPRLPTNEPHYGEPVEVIVERSAKAILALLVQHILDADLYTFADDQQVDLAAILKNPARLNHSDLAKWVVWMMREELIIKSFGSLESFYATLHRLREEGKGYLCRLYECCGFSHKLAEFMLRNDHGALKMLDFLYNFAPNLDERRKPELKFNSLLIIMLWEFDWWDNWNPGTDEELKNIRDYCSSKDLLATKK